MGIKKKIKNFLNISSKKKNLIAENLEEATWENTNPFVPKVTYGRVIKCYDVDTCTLVSKPYESHPPYRFTLRLAEIDGPEIRSKNEIEKEAAQIAKGRLSEKILNMYVHVTDVGIDKYGRLLCKIWLGELCINEWLLEQKLVVPYDGGKKKSPENWLEYMGLLEFDE